MKDTEKHDLTHHEKGQEDRTDQKRLWTDRLKTRTTINEATSIAKDSNRTPQVVVESAIGRGALPEARRDLQFEEAIVESNQPRLQGPIGPQYC